MSVAEERRGKVLVLEDDEGVARLVRLRLERLGYEVVSATTPDDALRFTDQGNVDLVVLDYRLRGNVSGLEFYRQLQTLGYDIPAILVTGFSDEAKVIEAIRSGVRDFVPKTPDYLDYLPPAIERVMTQVRTKRQAAESEAIRQNNAQLQQLITERARLEQELRASNDQLLEANRRKDEFLAMLAHELRNPLAAIGNCIGLLRRRGGETHREWCQEVIDRQAQHLGRLIDDLLDVSRITRGKIDLQKQPLDLHTVVARAVSAVQPLIELKHHSLKLDLVPGPLPLEADPTRLEQILVNLLSNAAKYTDQGGEITISTQEIEDEIFISFKDSGVGLESAMLPRIFDLFAQVDHSLERSQGGLGIGLTLARRLALLHGGDIEAQSEGLGKGSTFTVRLPRPNAEIMSESTSRPTAQDGMPQVSSEKNVRVLVVDDSIDTARGMAKLLQIAGYIVQTAFDGPTAIEAALAFRPDVVLLDIGLPTIDGYQVARAIRQNPGGSETILIAISGYAQERDQMRSREAGFDHHMVKPVDLDTLFKLIADELNASSSSGF